MVDAQLVEALQARGCPVCHLRRKAELDHIRSFLWENVNDPTARRELRASGGTCGRHSRALLTASREQSGPPIGAAIVFEAMLRQRLERLEALRSSRGRSRRRAADLRPRRPLVRSARPGSAPPTISSALSSSISESPDAAQSIEWRSALMTADLCLADLTVFAASEASDGGRGARSAVVEAQLGRLADVVELLERFVHHNSHDRRHLVSDDEREAVRRAERLLAGEIDSEEVSSRAG